MTERITWTEQKRKLGELLPWQRNPRVVKSDHARRLLESVEEFGQIETLAIGPNNELYNGHQRLSVLRAAYGADYMVDVRVASRPLTEKEREKLTVYLHKGATGEWDFDILANEFEIDELLEWGFEPFELGLTDLDDNAADDEQASEDDELERFAPDAPDILFPSDNLYDVPTLDITLQADNLVLPIEKWGDKSRRGIHRGTYHFYTEDYKFLALWNDPTVIVNSQCVAAVEPNLSTNEMMPAAVGHFRIYQKRWMARFWQDYGVKIFVDLTVDPKFYDFNLLGVPDGWRAFATRAYSHQLDLLEREHEMAKTIAGGKPVMIVIGGGVEAEQYAKGNGLLYVTENMHIKDGRRANWPEDKGNG